MNWLSGLAVKYLKAVRPDEFGRVYAAASKTISTPWVTRDHDINDVVEADGATIRSRVRQLVRDMPHAARACQVLTDLTVGTGIQVQPRVLGPDGKPIAELNRRIEEAWRRWMDEADAGGRMCFGELQQLAKRCEIEAGEFFFLRRLSRGEGRMLPYQLVPWEPDYVVNLRGRPLPGNEVCAGVEYDIHTSAPRAYWLAKGVTNTDYVRVPAAEVIHGFQVLRPWQLRGVSPLAPAVLLAHNLRDFLEAEIDGAKMAARYLAFVTSPDPAPTMAAFGATADSTYTDSAGNAKHVEELGTAIKEYLAPGEDVKLAEHNRPGDAFTPFTRFCLRTFAALSGISYELISGDYESLNYSVLRGIRNDLLKGVEVHQQRMVRQLVRPVYRDFLRWAVTSGVVVIPDYFSRPWDYERAVYTGPGMAPVDPLKEMRADADAAKSLLKSPVEAIRARGRDPEEVLDEIAQFRDMAEARGLEPETVSAAGATNPAALEAEAEDEEDEGQQDAGDRRLRRVR